MAKPTENCIDFDPESVSFGEHVSHRVSGCPVQADRPQTPLCTGSPQENAFWTRAGNRPKRGTGRWGHFSVWRGDKAGAAECSPGRNAGCSPRDRVGRFKVLRGNLRICGKTPLKLSRFGPRIRAFRHVLSGMRVASFIKTDSRPVARPAGAFVRATHSGLVGWWTTFSFTYLQFLHFLQ